MKEKMSECRWKGIRMVLPRWNRTTATWWNPEVMLSFKIGSYKSIKSERNKWKAVCGVIARREIRRLNELREQRDRAIRERDQAIRERDAFVELVAAGLLFTNVGNGAG